MCSNDNHQGQIVDTSITRRSLFATLATVAAAGGVAGKAIAADLREKTVTERDVTVKTADGSADAALFYPSGVGKWPAVLMWPDILGLRPVFREMGKRLAAQGYVVLLPNPYYRTAKAPVVTGPFDFGNPADMKRIMIFRNAVTDTMVDTDSAAFVDFLDAQPQSNTNRKAAVQGFCMSGPFAFRTAAARPERISAVGTFHPGPLVTDQPSSPHLLIGKTKAAYLVLIAHNDALRMPKEKEELDSAFAAAHRSAEVKVYPADHGWTVAGSATYNEQQAERAWGELLPFLRRNIG